jgi:predicted nucleic acid-binding protein
MKILDASPVICVLKEIKEPKIFDICETLGHELYVTKEVYEELKKNERTFKKFQEYGKIAILPSDKLPFDITKAIDSYKKRYPWIHDGEASVICVGHYLKDNNIPFYCIIDEKARNISKEEKLPTTGTIGLIIWERDKEKLGADEIDKIKKELRDSPFRINEVLLKKLDS